MCKLIKIVFLFIALGITVAAATLMIKGLPIKSQIIEKVIENDHL